MEASGERVGEGAAPVKRRGAGAVRATADGGEGK